MVIEGYCVYGLEYTGGISDLEFCHAQHDYTGSAEGDLSFQKKAVIAILNKFIGEDVRERGGVEEHCRMEVFEVSGCFLAIISKRSRRGSCLEHYLKRRGWK
jgi:hypothetical protein